MATLEELSKSNITQVKNNIERLQFDEQGYKDHSPDRLASPSSVTFTIEDKSITRFYKIQKIGITYAVASNFKGGCSQSLKIIRDLDLEDLYTFIEALNMCYMVNLIYNPSKKYSYSRLY